MLSQIDTESNRYLFNARYVKSALHATFLDKIGTFETKAFLLQRYLKVKRIFMDLKNNDDLGQKPVKRALKDLIGPRPLSY